MTATGAAWANAMSTEAEKSTNTIITQFRKSCFLFKSGSLFVAIKYTHADPAYPTKEGNKVAPSICTTISNHSPAPISTYKEPTCSSLIVDPLDQQRLKNSGDKIERGV